MVRFAHYMGIVHPSLIRCASVGVNILCEKFGPRDEANMGFVYSINPAQLLFIAHSWKGKVYLVSADPFSL